MAQPPPCWCAVFAHPGVFVNILIVGPSWVGDMVLAQSLFKLLKERHPDAQIDVLAPAWSAALLKRMPQVRTALTSPFKHGELALSKRRALGRRLRASGYAHAIVLPNSFKAALAPFFARIPQRTGYIGEWRFGLLNDARPLDTARLTMTVQRFLALGLPQDAPPTTPFPVPVLEVRRADTQAALESLGLASVTQPLLALCPGAEFGPAKRWPPEYFAKIAQAKLAEGWRVWIFGSDKDRAVADQVAAQAMGAENLAGRTELAQAIDLMALSSAVVSNDSGLMHVAAALGKPLVAIYGSSDPGFTPPMSRRAQIVRLEIECSPCFQRECPLGHLRCLRGLEPSRIVQALDQLDVDSPSSGAAAEY